MKLLQIKAKGLEKFKGDLSLMFYAQQRVSADDRRLLHPLFGNVYQNCANGFIGINASGKTSILRLIDLVLNLLNSEPINHIETRDVLGENPKVELETVFVTNDGFVEKLVTTISSKEIQNTGNRRYVITDERLYRKSVKSAHGRSGLTDFAKCRDFTSRNHEEMFLPDDVSIVIAENKKKKDSLPFASLLKYTDVNVLRYSDEIPAEIIRFLDPSIESLDFGRGDSGSQIHLKFKDQKEIILNQAEELNRYLSSGTIKGIETFVDTIEMLKRGGIVLVDEIENHFNKEIVATLIRFFLDSKLNRKGAVLIFSTHYPELLDEFSRNDSIYIVRNRNGITADNLSTLLKRNDIKKSDAYESGLLDGTVPAYEAYMTLKKKIKQTISGDD